MPEFKELTLPNNINVGDITLQPLKESEVDKPGFFESVALEAIEYNPEINLAKGAYQKLRNYSASDEIPEGWSSISEEAFTGVQPEYWMRISEARSPKEQQLIKQQIQDEVSHKDYLNRGSWVGRLIGGIGGSLVSFASKLPIAAQFKAATPGAGFLTNFGKAVPGMAAQSALVNATRLASNETYNLDQWFLETTGETIFGSAISGTMGANFARKLAGRKKFLQTAFDDVQFEAESTADGEFKKWVVKSNTPVEGGGSVGAMAVPKERLDYIQSQLDDGIDTIGESYWFKKFFKLSPVVRGLTSPYMTTRKVMAAIARPSGMMTVQGAAGNVSQSAEQIAKGFMAGSYNMERILNMHWADYAGFNGPFKDAQAALKKRLSDGSVMTRTEFSEKVSTAFRNGDASPIAEVAQASKDIRKHYNNVYESAQGVNLLKAGIDPITAVSYLNRVYNKPKMQAEEGDFLKALSTEFMQQSEKINKYLTPLNALKSRRQGLTESIKGLKGDESKADLIKILKIERETVKQESMAIKKELEAKIASGEIDKMLVGGKVKFTNKELELLKNIKEPLEKAKEELKIARKSKDKEKIKSAKERVDDIEHSIRLKIEDQLVPKHVARKMKSNNGQFKFKLGNPDENPWFRKPFESWEDAFKSAKRYYDTILQNNEEQMIEKMYGAMEGAGGSPLMSRTLLVRDSILEPWLINDMSTLCHLYTNFMGRKIGLQKVLGEHGDTEKEQFKNILKNLKDEFEIMKKPLLEKESTPEIKQKLRELNEKFQEEQDFLNDVKEVYWGRYNIKKWKPKTRQFWANIRNWTASTALGALPLLQMQDIGQIIKQYGFGEFLENGVFPMVASCFKSGASIKGDLAHAALGIETAINAHSDALWGHGTQYHPQGWLGRFFASAANKFGNITGSNQITDALQTIAGGCSQSKTIATLKKFQAGQRLTKAEEERLVLTGLNKHEWADRILNQYEIYGNKGTSGGHICNYENWHDFEASQMMLNSIQQEVQSVVLTPNYFDVPLAFKDPFIGSITMFMGYSFAATNHRLVPLLQRPDGQKIMGELITMTLAAFVDPMRQAVSGQEPDLSTKALLASALTNGSPGGIFIDMFNRTNAAFEIPFLKEFKTDRYRGKGIGSLFLGAPGTLGDNIQRVVQMAIDGKISETDAKRMAKICPWASTWWLRGMTNATIEAWGLPKTRRNAEGWFSE